MSSFFLTVGVGLAAGAGHVITGPDHMAAVAPVAANQPRKAALLGFKWGLGHSIGACGLGFLALAVRGVIDVEGVSRWSEFLVGFMIIGIGLWGFRAAVRTVIHSHHHEHDGSKHQHLHVHQHEHEVSETTADSPETKTSHHHRHGSLYLGILHGAAGMGHLLAVVPSLALPTEMVSVYLLCYFFASITAMTAFGFSLGFLALRISGKGIKGIMYTTSGAAVLIGTLWVINTWPGNGGHGHHHWFFPHPQHHSQEGGHGVNSEDNQGQGDQPGNKLEHHHHNGHEHSHGHSH